MFEQQIGGMTWRIVEERREDEGDEGDEAPVRFAVVRDNRRVAWGLHDQAAAARWLRRLTGPALAMEWAGSEGIETERLEE